MPALSQAVLHPVILRGLPESPRVYSDLINHPLSAIRGHIRESVCRCGLPGLGVPIPTESDHILQEVPGSLVSARVPRPDPKSQTLRWEEASPGPAGNAATFPGRATRPLTGMLLSVRLCYLAPVASEFFLGVKEAQSCGGSPRQVLTVPHLQEGFSGPPSSRQG